MLKGLFNLVGGGLIRFQMRGEAVFFWGGFLLFPCGRQRVAVLPYSFAGPLPAVPRMRSGAHHAQLWHELYHLRNLTPPTLRHAAARVRGLCLDPGQAQYALLQEPLPGRFVGSAGSVREFKGALDAFLGLWEAGFFFTRVRKGRTPGEGEGDGGWGEMCHLHSLHFCRMNNLFFFLDDCTGKLLSTKQL